jgi:hypothetical protein
VKQFEIFSLALTVVGLAVTILLGLITEEWRAKHIGVVEIGRSLGIVLLGIGIYLLIISFLPIGWNQNMIYPKISMVVGAILLIGGGIWHFVAPSNAQNGIPAQPENQTEKSMPRVGNRSVVYGSVPHDVGDDSVVVGATDSNGNTIIPVAPGGSAFGAGAQAGPRSLSMGHKAGAGAPRVPPAPHTDTKSE